MPNPPKDDEMKEDSRRLAGLIARMPDDPPPPGITAAVMRRIQPKQISRRQKWTRRLLMAWPLLPVRAITAVAAVVLIVGSFAAKEFYAGRKLPATGVTATDHGRMAVTLVLDWPAARKVTVIGSFNHWNPDGYQMHRNSAEAPWQLILELGQGKYQYAFVIDDQRVVPDPGALWLVDDGFGNRNSALIVENGRQNAHES